MFDTVRATSQWSFFYFFLVVGLGNLVLLNIFLAVLIDSFLTIRTEDRHKLENEALDGVHTINPLAMVMEEDEETGSPPPSDTTPPPDTPKSPRSTGALLSPRSRELGGDS
jgi:hypothetical protein